MEGMEQGPGTMDTNRGHCRVLIVDDEETALKRMSSLMEKQGHEVHTASTGKQALELLNKLNFDIILTDLILDSIDGLTVLTSAKEVSPDTEVIVITGYASVDSAIQATRKGAFHYLQKPIRPTELQHVVEQALEKHGLKQRVRELEQNNHPEFGEIIGNSSKTQAVRSIIRRIRQSEANVLITGESGTGKELIARAIHQNSRRSKRRFLAFNCASFTDELLANELFGHAKDAYTGASKTTPGLLESTDGGTVFFDEVGDMSPSMQAKILRVIQEKELFRVGSSTPVPVDIRIISATNKDIKKLVEAGIFRQDLYFRLNVIAVKLPTLEQRKEDIPLLGMFFLRKSAERIGKHFDGFTEEAMGLLMNYGYPGNIRELENIVERAAALAQGEKIEANDLPADLRAFETVTFRRDERSMKSLSEIEEEYIQWVLKQTGHNKTQAAQILGIDRVSLYRKLKKLEFDE
ncbi:MAG: sigma-54 dependent transcriptional regulator [Acidobacteriota bacterium]